MKTKRLHFIRLIMAILLTTACSKRTVTTGETSWIEKKGLTMKEIIDSVVADVDRAKSFKYTSSNSKNVNFYGGQKTNLFLLDKKGNAFSNRNREQNFRIDGKIYTRKVGLKEEGPIATVISDILDKSTLDEEYFERNIPYVKDNGKRNAELLERCRITTSASGNTLTIKTTDFGKIGIKGGQEYMTDVTVTYIPHKLIKYKATFLKDGKTSVATYTFTIEPDEEVKLPQLLKIGEKLSIVNSDE